MLSFERPSPSQRPAAAAVQGLIVIAAGALLCPDAVRAQQAAQPAGEAGLGEIVVTASRREESLSKVPISITALTQDAMDLRGIKDFQDVAKFTPGVIIDNSGTNNIAIRGIASSGGGGTTGIYIDDTPIQIRALGFNPDDALPKSFDIDRVEVLRGPQGTLFGAGSEGGTVRYITTQPSLTKTSVYGRSEVSFTQGGDASYEAGVAAGGPLVDGKFGARATVWYRRDGGWIDRVNPTAANPLSAVAEKKANYSESVLLRLAGLLALSDAWTMTPAVYYQDSNRNDVESYWLLYSNPGSNRFANGNPTQRSGPDRFYLPSLKIEGDLGSFRLISNTSYFHRRNTDGYDGTTYNLSFYQIPGLGAALPTGPSGSAALVDPTTFPFIDAGGVHLPASIANYRSPASVQNSQQNITQEIRLQSSDPNAKFVWTTGVFFTENRQSYLEQIYDPMADQFFNTLFGEPIAAFFSYCSAPNLDGTCNPGTPFTPTPLLANGDSYLLSTRAKDQQYAWFGEGSYAFSETLKATLGLRLAKSKYSFSTLTEGSQVVSVARTGGGEKSENSFTPKVSLSYQLDPANLYYFTYAKGFRPGGGNNPVPQAACAGDFAAFGITQAPATFDSDSVNSFEVGAKNNFNNKVRLSSSIYYIRWNNIQQTVVPPVCQISFISNLGQAVAKGADVQAEIAVTPSFTLELTAGYTDARYTKDSRLTPAEVKPIVASGDSIVGQNSSGTNQQPGAPFTASAGFEYKFSAMDHESFVRADYSYAGAPKWAPANQNPATLQYDPGNFALPATNFVTLRGGTAFGAWSLAAFVDNLTDAHTLTSYQLTINPGTGDSRLRRDWTFRPRTFGLTFTYRQ
jgi:iron complex outermembrane recepter protein